MSLPPEISVRLREYEIAGEMCRNHDSLIRTGIAIFGAAQAAILAFIARGTLAQTVELVVLEFVGFWFSVVVFFTTYRLGHRYRTYMERARALEIELGMDLFNYSQRDFESKWLLKTMPGNKRTWLSLPTLLALVYIGLIIKDRGPLIESLLSVVCTP